VEGPGIVHVVSVGAVGNINLLILPRVQNCSVKSRGVFRAIGGGIGGGNCGGMGVMEMSS